MGLILNLETQRIEGQTPKGNKFTIEHVDGDNLKLSYTINNKDHNLDFELADDTSYKAVKSDLMQNFGFLQKQIWSGWKSTPTGDVVQYLKTIFNNPSSLKDFVQQINDLKELPTLRATVEAERVEAARIEREALERQAREEAARIEREDAERKAREEVARIEREAAERKASEEAARIEREATERKAREEAEKEAEDRAAREAEIAEMKEAEARELARIDDQMRKLEADRKQADAAHKEALAIEEEKIQAEKLGAQAKLIEVRLAHLDKLKAGLAKKASEEGADAIPGSKVDEALEAHKPSPVKEMEAKHFICQVDPANEQITMQYSSESADKEAGGNPDRVVLNKVGHTYLVDSSSTMNGESFYERVRFINKKHYPAEKRVRAPDPKILPSDIKSYGEEVPHLEMFVLALACWNPKKWALDVFNKEHFDFEGFRYGGQVDFFEPGNPNSGCMLSFVSTLDNDYVGKAIEVLGADSA